MPKSISRKNIALLLLVLSIGLFVLVMSSGVRGQSTSRSQAVVAWHRAELNLRAADAINNLLPTSMSWDVPQDNSADFMGKLDTGKSGVLATEAERTLTQLIEQDKHNSGALARKIVLEFELNQNTNVDLNSLENIDSRQSNATQIKVLLPLFQALYQDKQVNVKQSVNPDILSTDGITDVEKVLGNGWFKERALLRFYKLSEQKTQYAQLLQDIKNKSLGFIFKLLILGIGIIVFGLTGLLLIIWQLFFYRKQESSNESLMKRASSQANYGWATVLIVFCSWFSTQLLFGLFTAWLKKINVISLSGSQSIVLAATIALIYLLSNGPALIYIYLFALKPQNTPFLKGINWRFGNGFGSPVKLFGIACLAWTAAIPLVLLSYLLSVKLFNSGGSSNPVIAIVMDSANTNNFAAILLFYSTLGIMAPFVEESLFRGFFYSFLRSRYGPILSNVISAGLFAVAHLDPGAILPLFCLGSIFAYLFETTGSTVPSVIAHGLWNSGTFTLVLLLFGT